ncbi:kelch repeat and BTB domain-containing protein 11 [Oryzias melastigma]|uniref:kelch repeat and BTB domain-containing protein 11 n=1 Tax=Oryzias melastigma TaxID=30732 RepID=UPI00168CF453|nr:kelch repeat and BTB domain-containing protein 11 [Oryzias melastigma]
MDVFRKYLIIIIGWIIMWLKCVFRQLLGALDNSLASPGITGRGPHQGVSEEWKTNEALRTYHLGDANHTKVTVQTSTHAFHVDLQRLSKFSEYFRAVSQSRMKETSERLIHLEHVPSSVFHNLLEFYFNGNFKVPQEELGPNIQVSCYLLAEAFLSKCLSVLAEELSSSNCSSYLSLAQETCCSELRLTVLTFLSRNLLEVPHVFRKLNHEDKRDVIKLRTRGEPHLCNLRKENLTSWSDPETERSRYIFGLTGPENCKDWQRVTELPFRADKWCFTTVVLLNYLFLLGGHRQQVKRGWEFTKVSFRFNPVSRSWTSISPMIKHRRHFSAVACEGCIYAVGGWYLDSLVTPDTSTALYTAVECYDPWQDTWRFVSSLPLTDFRFSVSLSHDVPLATSLEHFIYVLGNVQRTGEKLFLQYNTKQDSWCELLPTLTRTDAELSTLYFLGATDKLVVVGGNNSNTMVTSFCVESKKWGQIRRAEKVAFAGQGSLMNDHLLMPSIEHSTVTQMDLQTLTITPLPPLPVSTCYDASFYLYY